MKIRRANSFLKDYRTLSSEIQAQVDKQLTLLLENPRHPSLMLKKFKGTDIFAIRVSKGYCLTDKCQYIDNSTKCHNIDNTCFFDC